MGEAKKRMDGLTLPIRPWLQDFSFPGMTPYGEKEVRAQIDATEQGGGSGWLLWDPNNKYTEAALDPEPSAVTSNDVSHATVESAPVAYRSEGGVGQQRNRRVKQA